MRLNTYRVLWRYKGIGPFKDGPVNKGTVYEELSPEDALNQHLSEVNPVLSGSSFEFLVFDLNRDEAFLFRYPVRPTFERF